MTTNSESFASRGVAVNARKSGMADRGRRRHVSWGIDFDTRCNTLNLEIRDDWDEQLKELWRSNKIKVKEGLVWEFGEKDSKAKLENFIAIDTKPFSTQAHHNYLFHQIRQSFVIGSYYPALVGACALGERILNHLVIDLRDFYKATPEYKRIYRKKSFDNWDIPIDTLEAWSVLQPTAVIEFKALKDLRHRSVHFNPETYSTLRDDALAAVLHIRKIIETQFGSHGPHPWFLKGTRGHLFIAQEFETNPFVQTYYLPNCPFVGPLFSMENGAEGWKFIDYPDYGEGEWTDDEFAAQYENRDPEAVARRSAKPESRQ